ncbi:MAG: hypothetical protein NTU49_07150, partial [Gammaproteobacteria bacterium]|nr:hypothetical protein [Gammaproteobacteria bacterium]
MTQLFTIVNPVAHKESIHWFLDFSKELIISTVGGLVGGALAYGWYIERKETRKNEYAKKSSCTKSLLKTQMVLSFQMQELHELRDVCQKIVDFEFANSKLGDLLKDADTKQVGKLLDKLGRGGKSHELFRATQFIIMKPSSNHVISMPHDIFDMKELKLNSAVVSQSELNNYFQALSASNRGYARLISFLERRNETRDMVFNQLIATPENESLTSGENLEKLKFL